VELEAPGVGSLEAPELELELLGGLAGGLTVTDPLAEPLIGRSVDELADEEDDSGWVEAPGDAERSVLDELEDDAPGDGAGVTSREDELLEAPVPAPVLLLPRSCPHAASAAAMAETAQTLANIRNLCSMSKTP
jgi:hypothetical protein